MDDPAPSFVAQGGDATVVRPRWRSPDLFGRDRHRLLEAGHGEAEIVGLLDHVGASLLVDLDERPAFAFSRIGFSPPEHTPNRLAIAIL